MTEWQKRFFAQPQIYWTVYNREHEPTGNFYNSREAAQMEVDYNANTGTKVYIMASNIHSLELSRARWLEPIGARRPR
jgi:hypothetical protein